VEELFVDTGFWIASLDKSDFKHKESTRQLQSLSPHQYLVTSEFVLTEFLNYFSRYSKHVREAASIFVRNLPELKKVIVEPSTHKLFEDSHRLYHLYLDKSWSLTDCSSFIIMKKRKITSALAFDAHFEQAGFLINK
jgi:predicted nucleic acid-binding protein